MMHRSISFSWTPIKSICPFPFKNPVFSTFCMPNFVNRGYTQYLKVLLDKKLIRPGGVLLADNVLKWGLVADDSAANPLHTNADQMEKAGHLREFNDAVVKDERVEGVVLPIFDGVNMVRVL